MKLKKNSAFAGKRAKVEIEGKNTKIETGAGTINNLGWSISSYANDTQEMPTSQPIIAVRKIGDVLEYRQLLPLIASRVILVVGLSMLTDVEKLQFRRLLTLELSKSRLLHQYGMNYQEINSDVLVTDYELEQLESKKTLSL